MPVARVIVIDARRPELVVPGIMPHLCAFAADLDDPTIA